MKRVTMMVLTGAMIAALAATALAQAPAPVKPGATPAAGTRTPRIERREARQHARINQGVRSGELTGHEARSLRRGQRHIDRMENHAKADGKVTPQERRRIARAQNHQSRRIYRDKHNERTRS